MHINWYTFIFSLFVGLVASIILKAFLHFGEYFNTPLWHINKIYFSALVIGFVGALVLFNLSKGEKDDSFDIDIFCTGLVISMYITLYLFFMSNQQSILISLISVISFRLFISLFFRSFTENRGCHLKE